MASEVLMPQMGFDMAEGTIVRWVKQEGEDVKRGDVIAEIETDKAIVELEADASGLLRNVVAAEGTTVSVGKVIAYIGTADEMLPESSSEIEEPTREVTTPVISQPQRHKNENMVPKASPVARAMAEEKGIDLGQIHGTGPGGRITKEDVVAYAGRSDGEIHFREGKDNKGQGESVTRGDPKGSQRKELTRMARVIARRTQHAKSSIPHYYVSTSVDMTRAMEMRKELNTKSANSVHVSVNDLIIGACSMALQEFPIFNSIFKEDHLLVPPHVNIGIAIDLPEGLIVPAILECEGKSLTDIARDSKDLGERARSGRLTQEEYDGGTFSISNLGMFDVDSFTAIINVPQSAVLAVGAVRVTPKVEGGKIGIHDVMQITLSSDHRVTNGADAARFIGEIKRLLESPYTLVG